jgi:hypothetical protein
MAALSITVANVKWTGGARPRQIIFGATVTAAQPVYKDTTDNEHKLADADALATAAVEGLALTNGYDGKEGLIAIRGSQINVGATTTAGVAYVAGTTAGEIVPLTDLTSGKFPTILFWGTGTALVTLLLDASPVAI